jgi:hypothetical protein
LSGKLRPLFPGPLHATQASSAAQAADKQSVALMAVVKNYTPRCLQIRVALRCRRNRWHTKASRVLSLGSPLSNFLETLFAISTPST